MLVAFPLLHPYSFELNITFLVFENCVREICYKTDISIDKLSGINWISTSVYSNFSATVIVTT